MKQLLIFFLFCVPLLIISCSQSHNQSNDSHKTKNLIIVTLDGYRWQEVFTGADSTLIRDKRFVGNSEELQNEFWAADPEIRRKKLMPFLWTTIAQNGQIYGNRKVGNKVSVANPYWFSYPGYNEIFTGYPDKRVDSNGYPPNPNTNVLEFINKQPGFKGKVAAFASWNAFTRILNEKRSGFSVNGGYEDVETNLNGEPLTSTQKTLNRYQHHLPHISGSERLDGSTFGIALQYLKINDPRVFYISFGDTDEFGHHGRYGLYLKSAHYADAMIQRLWHYLQSDPQYKNKTTLFITVDHGRGLGSEWTSHGSSIKHSDEI